MGFIVNLPITVPANMPNLSTAKFWLHVSQFALTLLTIIIVAPVISIEVKYWVSFDIQKHSNTHPTARDELRNFKVLIPLFSFPFVLAG